MPTPKRAHAIIATAVMSILAVTAGHGAAAQEAASDAEACLARPTVTCSVDLALAASADSNEDHARAKLVIRTARRLTDIDARKAYLDRAATRFFPDSSSAKNYLERERRVTDIAAAVMAGDDASADWRLGEVQNFQLWWETLSDVIDVLARAGMPDLAVALEARYRFTESVSVRDALGRDLGEQVWTTRQPLARALVRCDCGPDPLPMVLELPGQIDRLENAPLLYARRHDVEALMSFLTGEFGDLADIENETQREWVGYAFGLMASELPLGDVAAFLGRAPAWLTAWHFRRPESPHIYGAALARAVDASDRAAVAALVDLQTRDDIVWLSDETINAPDASLRVDDLLPELERGYLHLLRTQFLLAHGDARKALDEVMNSPLADAWRRPQLDVDDGADFGFFVMEPLMARGAFDVAEEAARQLGAADVREGTLAMIANARKEHASRIAPKDAAAMLAERWNTYRQSKAAPDAGRTFLFAVRDLIAAQPEAFPFE